MWLSTTPSREREREGGGGVYKTAKPLSLCMSKREGYQLVSYPALSLVPRLSPLANELQVTERWAGPGNKATLLPKSLSVRLDITFQPKCLPINQPSDFGVVFMNTVNLHVQ